MVGFRSDGQRVMHLKRASTLGRQGLHQELVRMATTGLSSLVNLDLPGGDVAYCPTFFAPKDADRLLRSLLDTTTWRQESVRLYGKEILLPRLTAWYGDEGAAYRYSGIDNAPLPWTPAVAEVKAAVESATGAEFNGALLNRYRTGADSVSWHADDEPEFGADPVIASVSFGATRTFQLRDKNRTDLRHTVELIHGSLLVMRGETQRNWVHQVPKTKRLVNERVNLTFRLVKNARDRTAVGQCDERGE